MDLDKVKAKAYCERKAKSFTFPTLKYNKGYVVIRQTSIQK